MHVLQAVALHFSERPLNGLVELRRAAEPVANRVGEHGQPAPGEGVAGRFGYQPRRRRAIRIQPRRRAVGLNAIAGDDHRRGDGCQ